MKNTTQIIYAALLVLLLTGCTPSQDASKPLTTLNIGYFGPTNARVLVAQRDSLFEKVFEKKGIRLNFIQCTNGPTEIEAFIANRIDVAMNGDQPSILAWAKGVDIKAVANFPLSFRNSCLMVADSVNIKSIKDLKGKKISILVGGLAQHWLYESLKQAGMKYEDVQPINLSGDAIPSLIGKRIDAAVLGEPNVTLCEMKKIAAKVPDSECPMLIAELLLVSGNIYRNHPEIIPDLIAIYKQANEWVIDHPIQTVDLTSTKITYKVPKDIIYKQHSLISKDKRLAFTDSVVNYYKDVVNYLKDIKAIPPKGTIADSIQYFYDASFVNKLTAKENQTSEIITNTN